MNHINLINHIFACPYNFSNNETKTFTISNIAFPAIAKR